WHDWDRDPFARGAYSYMLVGGKNAAQSLSRPVEHTLFFAGEATEFESGTVEAALVSGQRAARQGERALGQREATARARSAAADKKRIVRRSFSLRPETGLGCPASSSRRAASSPFWKLWITAGWM